GTTFTVSGDGTDNWGTADSFHFVYQPIGSSGEMTVRVTDVQHTNGYAKAGIMVRTSLDRSSASVILDVKPDGGVEFMARASDGASTDFLGGGFVAPFPVWLKLTRSAAKLATLYEAWVYDNASQDWK